MSFILSCDFWFCCGRANDDPADRYQPPPPPPPPPAQTQMVAVVQAPPVQQQPPYHVPSRHHKMPPSLVASPLAPAAMGYAMPPPQTTPYDWPHVPPTSRSYDDPPLPVMWQASPPAPAAPPTTYDPRVSPRAVPSRGVPSKSHDPFLLPAETTTPSLVPLPSTKAHDPSPPAQHPAVQAPWPPARQPSKAAAIQLQAVSLNIFKVPSKRYDDETPAQPAVAPTQTPPRATSAAVPPRVPSMNAHEPPPAPVAPSSQRPPETAWPTRQPSKTYRTQPEPPPVRYDTAAPAASMAPREPLNHCI